MRRTSEIIFIYGLIAAFASVAMAFIVAAGLTQRSMARIDRETAELLTNSLPSVDELSSARSNLRQLRSEVEHLGQASGDGRDLVLQHVDRARSELDSHVRAYAKTPWQAGERELVDQRLRPALERLDGELAEVERAGSRGGAVLAAAVGAHADAADEALAELVHLNHTESYAATDRILSARLGSARLAFGLELVSSVVAVCATTLAVRSSRRLVQLMKENNELQRARAEELDGFAQRVAHDLLSPLAVVNLHLSMLARRQRDAETSKSIECARRAIDRSTAMVRGILAFARAGARGAGEGRAPLDEAIREAVDEVLAVEQASPPEVRVEPFEDCEVACGPAVLGVMLSNLLANAAKYTRNAAVRRIVVRARVSRERGSVRIEVEDWGPGLPPGLDAKIFEPYVRAPGLAAPGLGLGLATVARLARNHGGAVGVRGPGPGALFWFELPLARPAPALNAVLTARPTAS